MSSSRGSGLKWYTCTCIYVHTCVHIHYIMKWEEEQRRRGQLKLGEERSLGKEGTRDEEKGWDEREKEKEGDH